MNRRKNQGPSNSSHISYGSSGHAGQNISVPLSPSSNDPSRVVRTVTVHPTIIPKYTAMARTTRPGAADPFAQRVAAKPVPQKQTFSMSSPGNEYIPFGAQQQLEQAVLDLNPVNRGRVNKADICRFFQGPYWKENLGTGITGKDLANKDPAAAQAWTDRREAIGTFIETHRQNLEILPISKREILEIVQARMATHPITHGLVQNVRDAWTTVESAESKLRVAVRVKPQDPASLSVLLPDVYKLSTGLKPE